MSVPLSDTRLTEIRELDTAATRGVWHLDPEGCFGPGTLVADTGPYEHLLGSVDFGQGEQADADREFVLRARTAVPELLAEVDRLRARLAEIAELHAPMGGDCGYCADETGGAHRWPCPTARLAAAPTNALGAGQ